MGDRFSFSNSHSVLATLFILLVHFLQVSQAEVFLWPEPQSLVWEDGPMIVLSPSFEISAPDHADLSLAVKRYSDLLQTERWFPVQVPSAFSKQPDVKKSSNSTLLNLDIVVTDLTADLQHDVDESYSIVVSFLCSNASLFAATVWGAMQGLETFSQLVRVGDLSASAPIYMERGVAITDRPLYPHRGVLLDIARNFYPVQDIKRTIRALSYNKLNVLHLHITDAQSFPLEIKSEPYLAIRGSFGPQFIYYQDQIRDIVQFGRSYGVRVIPEIDGPGHAASWGGAYPEMITCYNEFWMPTLEWSERYATEPGTGQLNPLMDKTYEVVKNVIDEVGDLFPDNFYHAGGDEIAPACWKEDKLVSEFLAASANHSLNDLLTKYVEKTRDFILQQNKTIVYWEDIILGSEVNIEASVLPPETTIMQTWNNGPINTKTLTAAGYRTIVSSYDFYYLDCGHGGWVGNDSQYDQDFNDNKNNDGNYGGKGGSYCAPYKTWARVYDYDITANLTNDEAKFVVGGEVALWSEQSDPTVLDSLLWPRSSAFAEVVWSGNRNPENKSQKRYGQAIDRLNDWRYRLVHRGINAAPLQPLWCLRNPRMCNVVY